MSPTTTNQTTIAAIQALLEALPDEAVRIAILEEVLQNRCRKCLNHDPQGSFWCCYDSRGE
jgi:uncharacterized protein YfdQ (DUF2303 family)